MIRSAILLLSLVICSPALAEIKVNVTKSVVLTGVINPKIVEDAILIGEDSKPVLQQAALIEIETSAKYTQVKARKSLFDVAALRQVGEKQFLLSGNGRYAVEVTTFDPDAGIDSSITDVILGDSPTPPDPDVPDEPDVPTPGPVPPDAFENIGQRVYGWTKDLPKRAEAKAVYDSVIKRIETLKLIDINSASEALATERKAALGADAAKWDPALANIQADIAKRWPLSKFVYRDYLKAISAGLQ